METRNNQSAIDQIFISVVVGICLGIIFDVHAQFLFYSGAIPLCGIALLVAGFFVQYRYKKIFFCVSLICFSLLIGMFRMEIAHAGISSLESSVGQKVTLEGVIDTPISKTYNVQSKITLSDGQTVLIYTAKYPRLTYGDKISVIGTLQKPQNFLTDQGNEFDYVSYLHKDNIAYILKSGKATIISHDNGNIVVGPLLAVKNWFVGGYQRIFVPDEADLMGGLTLGTKENISNEFRNSLVKTSTIHIIALSGYNVTIVANFLREVLSKIPLVGQNGALVGGAFGIIFFVLMTGMQSSAIRAGIMALTALAGRGTGRSYEAFRALVLAGIIMILWNPKFLVYDVSFQLSFLATLGMIFLTPIFSNLFLKVPENIFGKIPLREMVSTTLGAQTAVLPFIIYKMGILSLIALPANIMVLPTIPLAMGIGTIAGLVGNISVTLATPFAFATHLLLRYITVIINFFAHIPFAYVEIKGVSIFVCLLMYTLLIFWTYKKRNIIAKNIV